MRRVDGYAQGIGKEHGPGAQRNFEKLVRPFAADIDGIAAERSAINSNRDLTASGKARALAVLDTRTQEAKAGVVKGQTQLDDLLGEIDDIESRVDGGRIVAHPDGGFTSIPAPEPTLEQLMSEQELRGLLRTLKGSEVRARYLQAVNDEGTGDADPLLVSAVEKVAASFPLVDAMTREQARRMRAERSPFAGSIAERRARASALEGILGAARTALKMASSG